MSQSNFYLWAKVKWTLGIIQEVFRRLLHQGIWRKCIFARAPSNFAWWCKVESPLVAFSFCWSVSHGHAKLKNMLFRLLLAISPISSFLIHLHHLQLSSKSQSKLIALLLSLCIWIIINFICFLQFDSSPLSPIYQNHTLKWLQNFIKLISNSCKGIITTQKTWNSWELLSKICSFLVGISNHIFTLLLIMLSLNFERISSLC